MRQHHPQGPTHSARLTPARDTSADIQLLMIIMYTRWALPGCLFHLLHRLYTLQRDPWLWISKGFTPTIVQRTNTAPQQQQQQQKHQFGYGATAGLGKLSAPSVHTLGWPNNGIATVAPWC